MRPRTVVFSLSLMVVLLLVVAACGEDASPAATTSGATPTAPRHGAAGHGAATTPDAGAEPDLVFIDAMIVHHQSAVMMAEMALELSERDEIRSLADEIIEAQESEIEQMRQWRDEWYPGAPESDLTTMLHMAGMHMTDADMAAMRDADDFDQMFIDMMIPHHESAIEMATALQQTTERPELQQLTEEIITAQQAEIEQMRAWRTAWYGQ
jgi:uncharacterized protein (DUF305 family)